MSTEQTGRSFLSSDWTTWITGIAIQDATNKTMNTPGAAVSENRIEKF